MSFVVYLVSETDCTYIMNSTKGAEYDPTASPYRTQADWGMISLWGEKNGCKFDGKGFTARDEDVPEDD